MSEKIPTRIVFEIAETIKKLSTQHANAALVIQAYCAQHDGHEAEVKKLRQTHWDMRAKAGFDNDGDPTPEAIVSDFSKLMIDDWNNVIKDQQEGHDEWDVLQKENKKLTTEIDRLRAALAEAQEQIAIRDKELREALQMPEGDYPKGKGQVIYELQGSYDTDGITHEDSGDPLVYLQATIAIVEDSCLPAILATKEGRSNG